MCANEAFGADRVATGSDYPVLQDYEACTETFACIERLDPPVADRDKIPRHNRWRGSPSHTSAGAGRLACCRGTIVAYTRRNVTAGQ